MKKAEDFRSIARDTLAGKWKNAVLVGLVASLLGAVDGSGLDVNIDIEAGNAKVSYAIAGEYTPKLTLENMWGSDSKTIDYITVNTGTGIEESVVEMMGVYPNPFTDFVNIMFTEEGVYTAQIVALDGRLIEDKVMSVAANEGVRIDINGEQGTYILRILNDKGVAVRTIKLIKK